MKPFKELPLFTEEELSALKNEIQKSSGRSTITGNIVPRKNPSLFINGGFIQLSEDQENRLPANNAIKVLFNKHINDNSGNS